MTTETTTQPELSAHHPESKLQHDFARFQIEYRGTRLMRYDDQLIYNCGRTDEAIKSAIKEALDIIVKFNLQLTVERNSTSAILANTLIIHQKD